MTKNYMINFSHDGINYYANVHEVKNSPAVYHVRIVAPFHADIPRHIDLHEENGKIISDTEISDSFFESLRRAIRINEPF